MTGWKMAVLVGGVIVVAAVGALLAWQIRAARSQIGGAGAGLQAASKPESQSGAESRAASAAGAGLREGAVAVGSRRYAYLVHVPKGYEGGGGGGGRKYPVVIVLHGGGDSAKYAAEAYGMREKADAAGFVAVFPNMESEEAPQGTRAGAEPDDPELALVGALLDAVERDYAVDKDRVFLCGHSAGAIVTYRAASEMGDRFAAFGIVAGTIGTHEADGHGGYKPVTVIAEPKRPASLIIFHGKEDPTIPYGPEGTVMSVAESVAFWVKANGCGAKGDAEAMTAGVERVRYLPKDGGVRGEIVVYTLEHGNHMWPGGKAMEGKKQKPPQEISATDLMWDFFKGHPRGGK